MTHTEGTPSDFLVPPPPGLEAQYAWETECVSRGIARYRRDTADAEFVETVPGRRAVNDAIGRLVPHVRAAQERVLKGIETGSRAIPAWGKYVILMTPEKLAYITLRTAFVAAPAVEGRSDGTPLTALALTLGNNIQLEAEFEAWADTKPDQLRFWKQRIGAMDAGTYKRWRAKLENIHKVTWPRPLKIQLGSALLKEACTHSAGWLEMNTIPYKGRTEHRIFMSEEARKAVFNIHNEMEIKRPYLLPMLCPPRPWTREN